MKHDDLFAHRRTLLRHLAALSATIVLPGQLRGQVREARHEEFVEVDTTEGRLRGERQGDLCIFRGVRYAGAPTGGAGFKAPPPLPGWRGVRDALVWGHPAMQKLGGTFGINEPAPAEDCLFLNIWTPSVKDGGRRPVMFYNHGGGLFTGSGASVLQDGSNLACKNDVVVVQSNHRLGLMGYLFLANVMGDRYGASGNAGLLDIVAALEWTRRNIAAFGGDPSNVIDLGGIWWGRETLASMPCRRPVRCSIRRPSKAARALRMTDREQASRTTQWVLDKLGLSAKSARKLLEVPAEKLLEVQLSSLASAVGNQWGPKRHRCIWAWRLRSRRGRSHLTLRTLRSRGDRLVSRQAADRRVES